jgi:hypothetical protein
MGEFWHKWVLEIFPSLLKQKKIALVETRCPSRVMLSNKKTRKQLHRRTHKYARVTKVYAGLEDRVCSADVDYKVTGESKFRTTTRLIHKLVLIIPVDEQTLEAAECNDDKEIPPPALEQIPEGKK